MKKYWKIFFAFVLALYWNSPQIVYASFGGGSGGGGQGGGGSSTSPTGGSTGTGGQESNGSFIIGLISFFIFWQAIKWMNRQGNRQLAKEIEFDQCYRSDLTALFIRFQKAWTRADLSLIEDEMTGFLYAKNQKNLSRLR
ncbi:hypothetical protein [Fructobacillus papyrifericola]|uniref:Uncharacterized protein n=1 Tax=Fructobacillus papyrifericola TaxID=2713172 RepID=A0ABS5QUJ4_9LACO|nr:hypothetical protein [Fructobacillus papyrifericola]MBS9336076.1 hypothetical protein [Fructobacillus papyrifericola]